LLRRKFRVPLSQTFYCFFIFENLHTQGHHHQDSRSFSITMSLSMCFVFVTIIKLIQLFSAMGALAKAILLLCACCWVCSPNNQLCQWQFITT
jgi:hypothetical protein